MRRATFFGVGAVLAAGVLALAWQRQLNAALPPALPDSHPGAPHAEASARATMADGLRPLFGERWSEAERAFVEAEFDLNQPFDPSLVPPWETARARLAFGSFVDDHDLEAHEANAVAWVDDQPFEEVDFGAETYDPSRRPLCAADLVRMREIADHFDPILRALGEESGALFTLAMEDAWAKGQIERYPLVALEPSSGSGRPVRALRMINMSNWNVMLVLRNGDSPEYEETLTRIDRVKAERFAQVREYLAAR
ncbi:MAG: hypothetical protein ACKVWV_10285 [Planctomycetota bacterium]